MKDWKSERCRATSKYVCVWPNASQETGRIEQQKRNTTEKITHFDNIRFDGAGDFNVPLQINVQKLEDEVKFLFGVDNIQKPGIDPQLELETRRETGDMIEIWLKYDWNDGRR